MNRLSAFASALALLLVVAPAGADRAHARDARAQARAARTPACADPSASSGVVATEHPAAARVGLEILAQGGSAVDAAIATSLAVCVAHPSSCGVGGGGFMVIYDAAQKRATALDYRETAPRRTIAARYEKDGHYLPERSRKGGLAVGVPGEIAGLWAAHERYGRLPWRSVVAPAAALARNGIEVDSHLARAIPPLRDAIARDPELASILLDPSGQPLAAGATLENPNLAATLDAVGAQGPAAFYRGARARSIAAAVAARGGVLDAGDLAAYRPVWRTPLSVPYRGALVYTMPPPSGGGPALVLALRALAGYDLTRLGPQSPRRWHLFAELLKHGFADRARFAGDPRFDPPAPRMSAKALRDRVSLERTFPPEHYGSTAPAPADHGTAHVSVLAPDGSAVALTTTINTTFGALIAAPGTGVILNNEIDDFSFPAPNVYGLAPGEANRIAPGKRPASSMTPTVAVKGRRGVVAVGASGGPLIVSATLEVLTNVLDFGMPPEAAVAAPRIHHQWQPNLLLVETGISTADRSVLTHLGHQLREIPGVAAVSLATALPGKPAGGAGDPRKGGGAGVLAQHCQERMGAKPAQMQESAPGARPKEQGSAAP